MHGNADVKTGHGRMMRTEPLNADALCAIKLLSRGNKTVKQTLRMKFQHGIGERFDGVTLRTKN